MGTLSCRRYRCQQLSSIAAVDVVTKETPGRVEGIENQVGDRRWKLISYSNRLLGINGNHNEDNDDEGLL